MKYLIVLLGMPAYIIFSILVGKFVYYLITPELTFIGELSTLAIEGAKVDGPTSIAFIVTATLILIGCSVTVEWWEKQI